MLENLVFDYEVSENQNDLFTPRHEKYNITISRCDDGRSINFNYQCNPHYTQPSLEDCMECYITDAQSYEAFDNIDDFYNEYGYTKVSEAIEAFESCKDSYFELIKFLTYEELEELVDELFND